MSTQLTPSPVNPVVQSQVRAPTVFEHVAFEEQPPLFVAHSSMSTHAVAPVPE
jgi:hypothetical protein